jgi:hypothetical protein
MDALTEQIWDAILMGDMELANELIKKMDQVVELSWFRDVEPVKNENS